MCLFFVQLISLLVFTVGTSHESQIEGRPKEAAMKWQPLRTVLLSAIGGAMVWWIVLGAVFGWMPPGSAEKKSQARAEAALLDALTPICVAMFHADADKETKRKALETTSAYRRGSYIVEQGWATLSGSAEPETRIAGECASRILATSSL